MRQGAKDSHRQLLRRRQGVFRILAEGDAIFEAVEEIF